MQRESRKQGATDVSLFQLYVSTFHRNHCSFGIFELQFFLPMGDSNMTLLRITSIVIGCIIKPLGGQGRKEKLRKKTNLNEA